MSKLSCLDCAIVATMLERSPVVPNAKEIISDFASPLLEEPSVM